MKTTRIGLLAAALTVLVGVPALTQSGQDLFQQALVKEQADGDLRAAIALYQRIVRDFAGDRVLAAKALVQMGRCYERLGDVETREARTAYERVVREFGDQPAMAAEARARLAVLAGAPGVSKGTAMTVRLVGEFAATAVSADGNHLSSMSGGLAITELATGRMRRVVTIDTGGVFAWAAFSPDSKQVAYQAFADRGQQLRISGVDGTSPRVLVRLESQKGWLDCRLFGWSPDGQSVLVLSARRDSGQRATYEIALISATDGSVRILKKLGVRSPGMMTFSPDGRFVAYDLQPKEGARELDIFVLAIDGDHEAPAVQHPASDRLLGWAPSGRHLLFASDRTGTWDACLIEMAGGRPQGAPVLVKKDIGQIGPLGFTRAGSFYYSASAGAQDVFIATLDVGQRRILTSPAPLDRRFAGGSAPPDWAPDGRHLAYVSQSGSGAGSRAIFIRSVDTGEERQVTPKQTGLGYNLRWSPDGRSVLVGGAYDAQGRFGAYVVSLQTGDVMASMPEVFWAEWRRDGKAIVCAKSTENDRRSLVVHNLETGHDETIFSGAIGVGLAVSWDGQWVAFSCLDQKPGAAQREYATALKIMPVTGGPTRDLLRLEYPHGIGSIAWTPDGQHLLFVRQALNPEQPGAHELWSIRTEGGEAARIGLNLTRQTQMSMNPDGQRIAYNAGLPRSEVWVMENFLPAAKPTAVTSAQKVKK